MSAVFTTARRALAACALACLACHAAFAQTVVLYDNGGIVTQAGAGAGGTDLSAVPTSSGSLVTGHSAAIAAGHRVADDFVVPAGGWTLHHVEVLAFQPHASPAQPPFSRLHLRIWSGEPDAVGSSVVFGDMETDRLSTLSFTGAWRVTGIGTDQERPVFALVASIAPVSLPAGHYWLEWQLATAGAGAALVPPVTGVGAQATGNALQFASDWRPLHDGGVGQALPFRLLAGGSPGGSVPGIVFADGFED